MRVGIDADIAKAEAGEGRKGSHVLLVGGGGGWSGRGGIAARERSDPFSSGREREKKVEGERKREREKERREGEGEN